VPALPLTDVYMNHLALYCRSGFEKECEAEILDHSERLGVHGRANANPATGFVIFTTDQKGLAATFIERLVFKDLVFCRQMFAAFDEIVNLPRTDRIGPILDLLKSRNIHAGDAFVETADTDDAKRILPFCSKFTPHFVRAARDEGVLADNGASSGLRLHLFFLSSDRVYAGVSSMGNSSGWYMGIPRLKFPKSAPSRSTLKLEEAFFVFLPAREQTTALREGMSAVDLGASPGGWTYQLVRRGIKVEAVDNGPMDRALMRSGLVRHVKTDGFSFRPARPVDWMVCDIVDQPRRIAQLAGRWMAQGWCNRTIFNLKLPMKKRYEEVKICRDLINKELAASAANKIYSLAIKQLYHDREEVTGFIGACEPDRRYRDHKRKE
jgi:23S rRNA (cytidine2498-2'-O)-methyltransferase